MPQPKRGQQPATSRLGLAFTSPVKRGDKRKMTAYVFPLGQDAKRRRLEEKLRALHSGYCPATPEVPLDNKQAVEVQEVQEEVSNHLDELPGPDVVLAEPPHSVLPKVRRIFPDKSAYSLFEKWSQVVPDLISPYLSYIAASRATFTQPPSSLQSACLRACERKGSTILCLFQDHFQKFNVRSCACQDTLHILVANGLFPTAPTYPRMAISIHLLDFYHALFERSCDAVNAMASALNTFYTRRGFILLNSKNQPIQDAFRRGLGYAIQWYDVLHVQVEQRVESALQSADAHIQKSKTQTLAQVTIPKKMVEPHNPLTVSLEPVADCLGSVVPTTPGDRALVPGECARILQQRCPACFAGILYGRLFESGADIQVAIDGNFNHQHLRSAGECPPFYEPQYIISKEQVDAVGDRIDELRKKPPKAHNFVVPDDAVDECESSHTAGSGSNSKTNMEKFDDGGLMALVCRHDTPLFLANIDTPGEQQKYAIVLIEHLFSFLPPRTTVQCLYDVACVLDRTLQRYEILSASTMQRLTHATSAMHAYAHQWACQIVYNPRFNNGSGLTDGEGVERLWSHMRKLIGITRTSARRRRIWQIDRQVASIGLELRDDLGDWIRRRLTKGIGGHMMKAKKVFDECGVSVKVLRDEWGSQRASQLSLRAHAPARLKKELDVVLNLQGDLDIVDNAIQTTRTFISKSAPSKKSLQLMVALEETQEDLKTKVEALYASLNIYEAFPELQGLDLEFVRTLIMARDLKINIRKRAIGSFFEWDRLDQAAGGHDQAIGTKLHQTTRKAISKRKPALMNAIRKFNRYCEMLENLYKPEWNIPLPEPLPTQLAALRDSSSLMEDVWITPAKGEVPRWLDDCNVREGIRAILKLDRCLEEQRRLGMEADNLCRWFGRELCAIEVALSMPSNKCLAVLLQQKCTQLVNLKSRWTNVLASKTRFDAHLKAAEALRNILSIPEPSSDDISAAKALRNTLSLPEPSSDDISAKLPAYIETDLSDDDPVFMVDDSAVPEFSIPESEVVILNDILVDNEGDNGEIDELNSAIVEYDISLTWVVPDQTTRDVNLLDDLRLQTFYSPVSTQHTRMLMYRGGRILFEVKDLRIIRSPNERLNDICLNGIVAVLHTFFNKSTNPFSLSSRKCALFTTFDLPMVRYNAPDADMWRRLRRSEYWNHDIWILPIHRTRPSFHWVLCVVYPLSRQLLLFDSFSDPLPWKREVKEIMRFVHRLVLLANKNGHPLDITVDEGWTAQPVAVNPMQTNGIDCGLWVLATIAAVLRGFHVTGMVEENMLHFRALLFSHHLLLPVLS